MGRVFCGTHLVLLAALVTFFPRSPGRKGVVKKLKTLSVKNVPVGLTEVGLGLSLTAKWAGGTEGVACERMSLFPVRLGLSTCSTTVAQCCLFRSSSQGQSTR